MSRPIPVKIGIQLTDEPRQNRKLRFEFAIEEGRLDARAAKGVRNEGTWLSACTNRRTEHAITFKIKP